MTCFIRFCICCSSVPFAAKFCNCWTRLICLTFITFWTLLLYWQYTCSNFDVFAVCTLFCKFQWFLLVFALSSLCACSAFCEFYKNTFALFLMFLTLIIVWTFWLHLQYTCRIVLAFLSLMTRFALLTSVCICLTFFIFCMFCLLQILQLFCLQCFWCVWLSSRFLVFLSYLQYTCRTF